MKVNIDQLADAVEKELMEYSQETTDMLKKTVNEIAVECKDDIKNASPKLTGKYKKSWAVKKLFESRQDIRVVVHNRKFWRLTHLLEKGHAGKGGTSVGAAPAYPHIQPAEEKAVEKLENKVKVGLRG